MTKTKNIFGSINIIDQIEKEIAEIRKRLIEGTSDNYEQDQSDLDYLLTVQRGLNARINAKITEIKNKGR